MSSIHYFQRYSQPENVATNNSLLLFSRLYQHSPNKFKDFLNDLLQESELVAGISFNKQERGIGTIPDGSLSQTSFTVVIETKLHEFFSIDQLLGHLNSFDSEEYQFLLSLSPTIPIKNLQTQIKNGINSYNIENNKNILFILITFKEIIQKFNSVISDLDFSLIEIINDFEDYCNYSGLITNDESKMRVVPCGWTLEENFKYSLYYDPATRGYSNHAYIGLYRDKSVRAIGKIENIIEADLLDSGELNIKYSINPITEIQIKNISESIPFALENSGYHISKGHKFFCVEKFYQTNYLKETKYPLQGSKFFNLKDLLNSKILPSTEVIAEQLAVKKW